MTTTRNEEQGQERDDRRPDQGGASMRAVVQQRYGGPEQLRLDRVPRPHIAEDECLVEVRAAGVDRGTWHVMTGRPWLVRPAIGLRGPRHPVPGLDVAGTVVAVGAAVTRFAVGDEVHGIARGSFAELAAAKERKLALKPRGLDFAQAAVVPVSGITALQGLRDAGRLQADARVLVLGGSGGVGSFAVQIAKALGAHVTATARSTKTAFVRGLGADEVIDHGRDNPLAITPPYDLILDIGGNRRLRDLRRALTTDGTLVIAGGEGDGRLAGGFDRSLRAAGLSPLVSHRLVMLISREDHADLEALDELIAAGSVTPVVDRVYPLDRAADALRALEAGEVRGKLAISV